MKCTSLPKTSPPQDYGNHSSQCPQSIIVCTYAFPVHHDAAFCAVLCLRASRCRAVVQMRPPLENLLFCATLGFLFPLRDVRSYICMHFIFYILCIFNQASVSSVLLLLFRKTLNSQVLDFRVLKCGAATAPEPRHRLCSSLFPALTDRYANPARPRCPPFVFVFYRGEMGAPEAMKMKICMQASL